jgi:hypothetical protein
VCGVCCACTISHHRSQSSTKSCGAPLVRLSPLVAQLCSGNYAAAADLKADREIRHCTRGSPWLFFHVLESISGITSGRADPTAPHRRCLAARRSQPSRMIAAIPAARGGASSSNTSDHNRSTVRNEKHALMHAPMKGCTVAAAWLCEGSKLATVHDLHSSASLRHGRSNLLVALRCRVLGHALWSTR